VSNHASFDSKRGLKTAGSTKAGFAVGHYEIGEFFACVECDDQPGQSRQLFFFVGSRPRFDQTDHVVTPGWNLDEPEMSGGVGPGCAEVGSEAFFRLEPGQRLVRAVGWNAWSCGAFGGGRGFCRWTGSVSDVAVKPITCVGSDGDEVDWSAGLSDGFPGWRTKKRLSGQSASSFLLVREEVFFVEGWRLYCLGRRRIARFGSPCLA
jgi:hypothetical protein